MAFSLGPISSGGGKGVVCYNSDNSVSSVELLELWEARVLYGMSVLQSQDSIQKLIEKGLKELQHTIYYEESGGPQQLYKDLKEITDILSQVTNVPKKEIYNYCLELKNEK